MRAIALVGAAVLAAAPFAMWQRVVGEEHSSTSSADGSSNSGTSAYWIESETGFQVSTVGSVACFAAAAVLVLFALRSFRRARPRLGPRAAVAGLAGAVVAASPWLPWFAVDGFGFGFGVGGLSGWLALGWGGWVLLLGGALVMLSGLVARRGLAAATCLLVAGATALFWTDEPLGDPMPFGPGVGPFVAAGALAVAAALSVWPARPSQPAAPT